MKPDNLEATAKIVRNSVPFQRESEQRGQELAFLPAALEIVETPPSPIGRMIVAALVLLFSLALAWAWWGTIDIVASASGKPAVTRPASSELLRARRLRS